MSHALFILALGITAVLFALLEIQIEGPNGWASSLPTWRVENRWTRLFYSSKPLTGYHLYTKLLRWHSFTFRSPSAWHRRLGVWKPASCPSSSCLGPGRLPLVPFKPGLRTEAVPPENIWWHAPKWWWIMPRDYWVLIPLAFPYRLSYANSTTKISSVPQAYRAP